MYMYAFWYTNVNCKQLAGLHLGLLLVGQGKMAFLVYPAKANSYVISTLQISRVYMYNIIYALSTRGPDAIGVGN